MDAIPTSYDIITTTSVRSTPDSVLSNISSTQIPNNLYIANLCEESRDPENLDNPYNLNYRGRRNSENPNKYPSSNVSTTYSISRPRGSRDDLNYSTSDKRKISTNRTIYDDNGSSYQQAIGVSNQEPNSDNLIKRRRLVLDTPFSTRSTISYGLIVYARDTKRWAIIQRKHSVEFLLFIRGLYRLTYLPFLLSCITKEEAFIIEKCLKGGPKIFQSVYLTDLELSPEGLEYALIRMAESRDVVLNLLLKLDISNNSLRWTWPKGRLQISSDRETPFECAKREFTEEVEIILPPPLYISDTYVSETVKTITGRNIESRYWIYIIPNEIPMNPPKSHPEVSDRMWIDTDTCQDLIRHHGKLNITSCDLFKQVVDMVSYID